MAEVDPFANVPSVIPGALEGADHEEPTAVADPFAGQALPPEPPHELTDDEIAARVMPGSLGGESASDEELEAQLDADLAAAVGEDVQPGSPEDIASTAGDEDPSSAEAPTESSGAAAPSAGESAPGTTEGTGARSARRRGRPRKAAAVVPEPEPEPTGKTYLVLGQGALDDGRTFYYIDGEITGVASRQHAARAVWGEAGKPADGIEVFLVNKATFAPTKLTVERVYVDKVMVR